jgi:hypothetical protein
MLSHRPIHLLMEVKSASYPQNLLIRDVGILPDDSHVKWRVRYSTPLAEGTKYTIKVIQCTFDQDNIDYAWAKWNQTRGWDPHLRDGIHRDEHDQAFVYLEYKQWGRGNVPMGSNEPPQEGHELKFAEVLEYY